MTWFWSTDLNPNESDNTFAVVEQSQKKEKKHPGICLVVCHFFLLSFIINSTHLPILRPLFFSFIRRTHDPQRPELAIVSLVLDFLFHRLVICHMGALSMKNSLNSLQSGTMKILHLQLNVSFYLNAPSIWASQISIDQYTMAK